MTLGCHYFSDTQLSPVQAGILPGRVRVPGGDPPAPPTDSSSLFPGETSMSSIDFAAVRHLASMEAVLGLIEWKGRGRKNGELRGPCPLCGYDSGQLSAFSVDPVGGGFHCFKCGAHGNQLDLYALATRQDIYRAARELCRRLEMAVPYKPRERKRPRQGPGP